MDIRASGLFRRAYPIRSKPKASRDVSNRTKERIILCANQAFIERGYVALSMAELAERCGLTRRGLYHHFSSKEEVFRAALRMNNATAIMDGDEAGTRALETGASPIDVIAAWLDARFGATRRTIGATPHGRELNDAAFRVATDIMIEVSYESNRKLAELVSDLCRRNLLDLRETFDRDRVGRLLGDGARGVNQARPPIPNEEIAGRYRDIVEAILYGCAKTTAAAEQTERPVDTPAAHPREAKRRRRPG